jgi:hypothetical protein
MPEPSAILEQLRAARAAHDETRRQVQAARIRRTALQREAQRLARHADRGAREQVDRALQASIAAIAELSAKQDSAGRAVSGLVADLHVALTPEALTQLWSAEIPILLLPLRVETRFKDSALLVRVFPDEIEIDSHEEIPTESEVDAGQAYWRALATDASDTARKEAWRKLVEAFQAPRASYVVTRTRPTNWNDHAVVGPAGLVFPIEPVLKQDGWTQPPLVKVLPDRLVLTLLRGGGIIYRMVGALIDDVVQAGPAPLQGDGTASWSRGPDGKMVFDANSEWLRDFDIAMKMGLGFRVALAASDAVGFDELIVLGLKHSADIADSEALFTELLAGHRYSAKGMALVPQGTATNNTSAEDAGLDTLDWFAEASFAAEEAGAAPPAAVELDKASDGQRLSAYLGLDPDLFARVPNADRHDHAEAVAMNAALYPGTLGYFLRTMIGEVAGDATLDDLRTLFTRSVTGRGPLAAIRVGNQPYGIVLAGPAPRAEREPQRTISLDATIERIIARARPFWVNCVPQLAQLGTGSDASANVLAIMGLQPTTAEYFQRIANTYDHLANLAGFEAGGDRMADVFASVFAGFAANATLTSLGYQAQRANGTQKPYPLLFQLIYQRHQTLIPTTSLIDGLPFSETDPIKPYNAAATKNYIDWLAANARSAEALRLQDFGGAPKPTALLYRLLRHALLIQAGTSINIWLKLFNIEAPELVVSRKFLSMTPVVDIAAWEILSAPASAVGGTVASDLPLLAMVHLPEYRTGANAMIGAPLDDMLAGYGVLSALPTARLERLLAEHLDMLSYRLDAWETALIDRRLLRRRATGKPNQTTRGLYLGALGYLENVQRAPGRRRPVEESALPEALREGRGNLYGPVDRAGFVHTPSLNHATAAAVLRNGYLTHATPSEPGLLAVNLGSRRVRRAKELMDGVRKGQPIEVLLGIEFERGLHEATTRPTGAVVLNDLKPAFRQAFPIRRTRIPRAGHPDDGPEIVPDYSCVNGLDIIAAPDSFPAGVAGLPALSHAKTDELTAIRDQLRDSLDALKDVVTSETAYQLALGNFDRSAAIVQSLSAAVAPPEIEVSRSARGTDLAFTQRLTIEFDPAMGTNPWAAIALTPRARLEPPLNAWIGALLGDPSLFACKVTLTEAGATTSVSVQLSELKLQPLDLLQVARGLRDAAGPAELEARIHAVALATSGATLAAKVGIAFAETGLANPGVAPMADAIAILDLAHQVIASARPIDGRDALTSSKPLPKGTEPSGIDVAELRTRFVALKGNADTLVTDLAAAVTNAGAAGAGAPELAALRTVLRRAADAGLPFAFPAGADDTLITQGQASATALAALRDRAAALDTASQAATLTPPQSSAKLVEAVQQLLGADFRVLPRFTAPNATDLALSDASRDAMLATARAGDPTIDPVSDVLTSVAQVRQPVHRLHRLRLTGELASGTAAPLVAIQLPPRSNDVWLGAALPADHAIFDDTLSIIQMRPQGFSPAASRCGLLVDEWIESFPRKSEVTGLAFGFDQPNSAPMQALLLAVAGEGQQRWNWDELFGIVRDTMLRAKLRGVEPDMLDKIAGVTTLLPATMAEFSTSPGALSLDFGLSVPIILSQVMETAYMADFKTAGTSP